MYETMECSFQLTLPLMSRFSDSGPWVAKILLVSADSFDQEKETAIGCVRMVISLRVLRGFTNSHYLPLVPIMPPFLHRFVLPINA